MSSWGLGWKRSSEIFHLTLDYGDYNDDDYHHRQPSSPPPPSGTPSAAAAAAAAAQSSSPDGHLQRGPRVPHRAGLVGQRRRGPGRAYGSSPSSWSRCPRPTTPSLSI
ncbi:hypothetical protein PR202_ga29789 [Eleusine coracana subsp. coracana]|uniref:Uncharacterized protein n=1 Tax=Eleusine coracana subsp. coracana TaxID=191504 RepID=A0AAV5DMS4_ELECO|nr:hypothetical protein PR202_ga29789 [Eleusine coracana subsp. coracana]